MEQQQFSPKPFPISDNKQQLILSNTKGRFILQTVISFKRVRQEKEGGDINTAHLLLVATQGKSQIHRIVPL